MTSYATPAQVRAVLTRNVAVPGGTAADLDDPTLQGRIDAAQAAEIDIALAKRYTVPFANPVPPVITQITIAIAAYLATLIHRQSLELDITDTDPAHRLYEWAVGALEALATGEADIPEVSLPDGTHDPLNSRTATVINPYYTGQLFGLDSWGLGYSNDRSRRHGAAGLYW